MSRPSSQPFLPLGANELGHAGGGETLVLAEVDGAVGIGERLLRVGGLEVRSKAFDRYVCREIQNRVEGLYRVLAVPRPVTQRFHVEPFVKQKVDVARIQ